MSIFTLLLHRHKPVKDGIKERKNGDGERSHFFNLNVLQASTVLM